MYLIFYTFFIWSKWCPIIIPTVSEYLRTSIVKCNGWLALYQWFISTPRSKLCDKLLSHFYCCKYLLHSKNWDFLKKNENTLLHLIMVSFGSVDASYSRRSIVVKVCYSAKLEFCLKNEKTWFDSDHLHILSDTIWVC